MPGMKVGTWDTLRLHPMTLMRMVIEGKTKVLGKDKRGRKIYEVREEYLNDSRQKSELMPKKPG